MGRHREGLTWRRTDRAAAFVAVGSWEAGGDEVGCRGTAEVRGVSLCAHESSEGLKDPSTFPKAFSVMDV